MLIKSTNNVKKISKSW